ncbi:MAG: hypothetical protein M0Z38_08825 [Deltaproteobacteria bacterium]|nr:hypothetical protein [Deltaproteobacteria bacterium]
MTLLLRFASAVALVFLVQADRSVAGGPGDDPVFRGLAARSWILAEPPRTFRPANLYEEIDGEAELFLPYDFRDLAVAYLSRKSTPGAQLRVELYRHGSPEDAFGIFSQHRFPGQETVPIGPSEAIASDTSLDFFRGDRFVRIRTSHPGGARGDLIDLGRAVSDLLEGTGAPPPETVALLVPGFVPGTLVYQKKAIFGYDVLAPGYEAKFSTKEASGGILLLPPRGDDRTASLAGKLAKALPGFTRIADGFYRAHLSKRTLWLQEAGDRLVGVTGNLGREQAELILSVMAGKHQEIKQ